MSLFGRNKKERLWVGDVCGLVSERILERMRRPGS